MIKHGNIHQAHANHMPTLMRLIYNENGYGNICNKFIFFDDFNAAGVIK